MAKTPNSKSLTAPKDRENRLIMKCLLKHKRPLTRRFISEDIGREQLHCVAVYLILFTEENF